MAKFSDRLLHYRLGFFIVSTLLLGIVASLPFTLSDAFFNFISLPSGRQFAVIGEMGSQAAARPIHLNLAVTELDEASLTVTVQVTARRDCALSPCTFPLQLTLYSLLTDADPLLSDQDILPPSVRVTLQPNTEQVNEIIKMPVHGNPTRYPFDTYDFWIGLTLARVLPEGRQLLSADEATAHSRLGVREQLTRLAMNPPEFVAPDRLSPVETRLDLAGVTALSFHRPLYLRVLALALIFLIAATAIGAVLMRPLHDLFIGAGTIVIGVWGVRTVLVPGFPRYLTAVDLSLSIVILFLLGAIVARLLLFFHERSRLPFSAARRAARPDDDSTPADKAETP